MAKAGLEAYRGKRDFARTGEPAGGGVGGGGNRFVVHKHHASSDHYDLRLELDGVLKSWAVPKGPSLDPGEKRLAVETEDHPLEYVDFEGLIPEGEYGGGPMIVWDTGVWAPMGDAEADLASGAFKFRLAGEKLNGGWMLARLKPKPGEKQKAWLFFKERDQAADPELDILEARPESVKSGRRIEELARAGAGGEAGAAQARGAAGGGQAGAAGARGAAAREPGGGAARRAATGCTRSSSTATGRWRTWRGGAVRLITRSGLDWTHRYGGLAAAFLGLPCKAAVIDGEIVALDRDGVSRFADLQKALSDGAGNRLRVLRLRPRAPERLGPVGGAAGAAQGAAEAAAGRRRRRARRSSSATTSRAAGGRSTTGCRRWGSRGWCRSAPRRRTSRDGRRPGPSARR